MASDMLCKELQQNVGICTAISVVEHEDIEQLATSPGLFADDTVILLLRDR
jgi:hypothetical protein